MKTSTRNYIKSKQAKKAKRICGLCKKNLHGVPHGLDNARAGKLSKTQKRPSVIFGGVLCNACRREVIEEAFKVKEGIKQMSETSSTQKIYIESMVKRL